MDIKIDNFEGPLGLLLQLIEKEELDITEVSLFNVAEQYINFLEQLEGRDPEILADFLLIASKLLYIKSKVLLPELDFGGGEEILDLTNRLKMYKKFVEASAYIEDFFYKDSYAFNRPFSMKHLNIEFIPSKSLNKNKLKEIFVEIVNGLERISRLPKKSLERVVSIQEKIEYIKKMLHNGEFLKFSELAAKAQNKTEIIVSFLGILELSKQRHLVLAQEGLFNEIKIKSIN